VEKLKRKKKERWWESRISEIGRENKKRKKMDLRKVG
jgi:hypothetical protein